jgi:general stress protein 26
MGVNYMDENKAKKESLSLIENSDTAFISTIGIDGFPQTRVVFNLRNKEKYPGLAEIFENQKNDFFIYFTTSTSSSKIEQIRKNSSVSVFFCNSKDFHSLMLAGKAEIVDDPEIKKVLWQDGWEIYYPKGIDDPDYSIVSFAPVYGKGWCKDTPFYIDL